MQFRHRRSPPRLAGASALVASLAEVSVKLGIRHHILARIQRCTWADDIRKVTHRPSRPSQRANKVHSHGSFPLSWASHVFAKHIHLTDILLPLHRLIDPTAVAVVHAALGCPTLE